MTAEALANTLYDALRLAVMLLCIGAANALANPRQALRSVPAALYEASVAVVIALSVAPQLIESAQRVRRARRLRGDRVRGLKSLGAVALPVLADAIERSMALAAGMESRGFARTRGLPVRGTLPLMLASVMVALLGGFLLLSTSAGWLAALLLGLGSPARHWACRRAGARLASHHVPTAPMAVAGDPCGRGRDRGSRSGARRERYRSVRLQPVHQSAGLAGADPGHVRGGRSGAGAAAADGRRA